MNKEKEKYENELNVIAERYGIGRKNRMQDLMMLHGSAFPALSLQQFMAFTERFGKVADDLAFFLSDDGNLLASWSFWVTDPARQRRGGLTRRVDLEFAPDQIRYFRYSIDEAWTSLAPDSEALKRLVDEHRTHRPAASH